MTCKMYHCVYAVALAFLLAARIDGFTQQARDCIRSRVLSKRGDVRLGSTAASPEATATKTAGKGFAQKPLTKSPSSAQDEKDEDGAVNLLSLETAKSRLVDLIPRMTGQEEEFRQVEALVNRLEDCYQPVQTLDFLNLLQQGDWQLIFSTNLAGTPNPAKFRLRELYQNLDCQNLSGKLSTRAVWDLAEEGDGKFLATGTFTVENSYEINQGARMLLTLENHLLEPAKGSAIPRDVPALVGLLHRAMPKELFDASEHAVDTTYLDTDLRIVRYTGPRFEGVRDIFIRRGALEINPNRNQENDEEEEDDDHDAESSQS